MSSGNVNKRDRYGQTRLMEAARTGDLDAVRQLIAGGAELNHTAKYGLSALMLAVLNGHADVVQALARAGAQQDLRGTGAPGFAGKTARDLANAQGDPALVAALQIAPEPN